MSLTVPTLSASTAAAHWDRSFFGHPRGLSTLFFTEMWERFSYYGMRAFLVLYMTASVATGGMGIDTATGAVIYGVYTSSVYLMNIPGAWLADRVLGQRRAGAAGRRAGHRAIAGGVREGQTPGLAVRDDRRRPPWRHRRDDLQRRPRADEGPRHGRVQRPVVRRDDGDFRIDAVRQRVDA